MPTLVAKKVYKVGYGRRNSRKAKSIKRNLRKKGFKVKTVRRKKRRKGYRKRY